MSQMVTRFSRAYLKMQCTAPNGEVGTFLYFGNLGADPKYDKLISPVFPDYVGLHEWMKANGWSQWVDKKGKPMDTKFYPLGVYLKDESQPARYVVEVSQGASAYKTRYAFEDDAPGSFKNNNQAVMYFNGINIGNGYNKRLRDLKEGKVMARVRS